MGPSPWQIILVIVVALLLFGVGRILDLVLGRPGGGDAPGDRPVRKQRAGSKP